MDYRLLLLLLPLLFFGCISEPQPLPDISNGTQAGWMEYRGIGTSFEFPQGMEITHKVDEYESGQGSASVNGIKNPPNKTLLTLIYSNAALYGSQIATTDPQTTVVDFLKTDSLSDPAGMLSNSQDVSQISNFTNRQYSIAQLTFSINVMGSDGSPVKYSGYAINMYNPQTSALYRLRVLGENGTYTTEVKDRFMDTFSG